MTLAPARNIPLLILSAYAAGVLAIFILAPPVPQPAAYHAFADDRVWLRLPNFANVASNLPLLLAAAWGLWVAGAGKWARSFRTAGERRLYMLFFSAVLATSLGSAFYHLAPDNASLLWDRLPLSVAFTTLPALFIMERCPVTRSGFGLLALWILVGPASVLWWHLSESAGHGDLRPYLLLHAFVLVLPPLLMRLPSPYTHRRMYAGAYLLYLAAMAGELLDHPIYALGEVVSGHTLKHLLMAIAVAVLARMLAVRRPTGDTSPTGSGRQNA